MNKHFQKTAIFLFLSFVTATGFAQTPTWQTSGSNLYLSPTTANLWLGLASSTTSSKLRIDNTLATPSNLYGLHTSTNNTYSGSGGAFGIFTTSSLGENNIGACYGIQNRATNNNTSSTANTFGISTTATSYNAGTIFGNITVVENHNTSTTVGTYGVFSEIKTNASNSNTVYGVYSKVTGVNGNKRWAGYFTGGDMYVSGNIGIGITNPTVKLDVAGVVRAHEVKVCLNQGCDYVFEPDYKLMPLSELSTFVKTKKHLPEVAPAAVMESEGINLSEMNALLLKKVEELTLYIIQQQEMIQTLNVKVEKLENQ